MGNKRKSAENILYFISEVPYMRNCSFVLLLAFTSSCSFFASNPEIILDAEKLTEDVLEDAAGVKHHNVKES
jgi:hypothetical protein